MVYLVNSSDLKTGCAIEGLKSQCKIVDGNLVTPLETQRKLIRRECATELSFNVCVGASLDFFFETGAAQSESQL